MSQAQLWPRRETRFHGERLDGGSNKIHGTRLLPSRIRLAAPQSAHHFRALGHLSAAQRLHPVILALGSQSSQLFLSLLVGEILVVCGVYPLQVSTMHEE
jgi:hypothetical protein